MFRKLFVPAVLSVAVLGLAVGSAQAQLRARFADRREQRMERRDTRRGIYRNTQTGVPYTYAGPGYTTQSRMSYYYSPTMQAVPAKAAPANFRVILPDQNARLFVDGIATEQTGTDRLFVTPTLQPGNNYTYVIRATYQLNGREVSHERTIDVAPGQTTILDLTRR